MPRFCWLRSSGSCCSIRQKFPGSRAGAGGLHSARWHRQGLRSETVPLAERSLRSARHSPHSARSIGLHEIRILIASVTRLYPQFPDRGESCLRPALVPHGQSQGSPLLKGHRQLQTALCGCYQSPPRCARPLLPHPSAKELTV